MATCNNIQIITPDQCIGDSLFTINNNFANLDEDLCATSTNVDVISSNFVQQITPGTNIQITPANGRGFVTINSIPVPTIGQNVGDGNGVYKSADNFTLNFKTLKGAGSTTLVVDDNTITFNTATNVSVSNLGTGSGIFSNAVPDILTGGQQLNFKSLAAGRGVEISSTGSTVTITSPTPDSVGSVALSANSVFREKIANLAVNNDKIATNTITNDRLVNAPANTVKGNPTDSLGVVQDVSKNDLQTWLGIAGIANANLSIPISVNVGGTGAIAAADARTNLGAQATITGAASTITSNDLTSDRAVISDASGKVAISDITTTELSYLDNATSNIQDQLNGKHPTITSTSNLTLATLNATAVNATTKLRIGDTTNTAVENAIYCKGTFVNNNYVNNVIVADHRGMGDRDLRSFYALGWNPRIRMDVTEGDGTKRHSFRLWAQRNIAGRSNGFRIEVLDSDNGLTGANGTYFNASCNGTYGRSEEGINSKLLTIKHNPIIFLPVNYNTFSNQVPRIVGWSRTGNTTSGSWWSGVQRVDIPNAPSPFSNPPYYGGAMVGALIEAKANTNSGANNGQRVYFYQPDEINSVRLPSLATVPQNISDTARNNINNNFLRIELDPNSGSFYEAEMSVTFVVYTFGETFNFFWVDTKNNGTPVTNPFYSLQIRVLGYYISPSEL